MRETREPADSRLTPWPPEEQGLLEVLWAQQGVGMGGTFPLGSFHPCPVSPLVLSPEVGGLGTGIERRGYWREGRLKVACVCVRVCVLICRSLATSWSAESLSTGGRPAICFPLLRE